MAEGEKVLVLGQRLLALRPASQEEFFSAADQVVSMANQGF